jgi:hypothetical protein
MPDRCRIDVERLRAALLAPLLHCRRDELRAVVAADVRRRTPDRRQLVQERHDVLAAEVPLHLDRQALPRVLVQNHQHPEGTAVRRAVLHEVHAADLVLPRRTATLDPVLARADTPAFPSLLGVAWGHQPPLRTPHTLHQAVPDRPALAMQPVPVGVRRHRAALRAPVLAHRPAGTPFGHGHHHRHALDRPAPPPKLSVALRVPPWPPP